MEELGRTVAVGPKNPNAGTVRKPVSEFKVVQNIAPLLEDKGKFPEWNEKFINAMGQVDPAYEPAI